MSCVIVANTSQSIGVVAAVEFVLDDVINGTCRA